MFEDSLLNTRETAQRRRTRAAIAASLCVQAIVCTVFLVTPMLWPERLPIVNAAPRMMRLTPELPKPKPQPVQPKVVRETTAVAAPTPQPVQELFRRGGSIVRAGLAPEADLPPLPGGFGAMIGQGEVGSPFGSPAGTAASGPAVVLARAARKPGSPLRISDGITRGMLLAPIVPVYPQIAKVTRTQGTVVITATIDKTGRIVGAQATSGPPLLRQAALDAVAAARYRPYLLNGEPTEVITTITVNFIIGS
jgi:protein TonB